MVRHNFGGFGGGFGGFGYRNGGDWLGNDLIILPQAEEEGSSSDEPVVFKSGNVELDEVVESCPKLKFILRRSLAMIYSSEKTAPFTGDKEYIVFMSEYYNLLFDIRKNEDVLEEVHLDPQANDEFAKSIRNVMAALQRMRSRVGSIVDAKLAASYSEDNPKPRILRFAELAKMNTLETDSCVFLVLCFSSLWNEQGRANAQGLQTVVGMSPEHLPVFLSKLKDANRKVLFEFDTMNRMDTSIRVSNEGVTAFIGGKLTSDEFLKIHGTLLADILVEEKDSPYVTSKADDEGGVIAGEVEAPMNEEGEPLELYEYIKMEADAEKERTRQMEEDAKGKAFDWEHPPDDTEAPGPGAEGEEAQEEEEEEEKESEGEGKLAPYTTDLEYLEDQFQLVATKLTITEINNQIKRNEEPIYGGGYQDPHQERNLREQMGKERLVTNKVQQRLQLTRERGRWLPRLERFAAARGLCKEEKQILLTVIAGAVSDEVQQVMFGGAGGGTFTVGTLLPTVASTLQEKMSMRKFFYKNAPLVKEGVLRVQLDFASNFNQSMVQVDKRMLDFIMGLESEFSEMVEGSHLYLPTVKVDSVILPDERKNLVLQSVTSFEQFKAVRKKFGYDDMMTYGMGLVILFYGPSGTGKTMLANAIGNLLNKKVLLINYPTLGQNNADEVMRMIFREARINDAIVFFDECEAIFEARDRGHYEVNLLLTELERHDGLTIMATNRPFDLDEAMHRRITLAIEFRPPDVLLREKIWAALMPPELKVSDDVDLKALSLKYELTGGFIKNAVLAGLSKACARLKAERNGRDESPSKKKLRPEDIIVTMADLDHGAKNQLRGRLRMADFYRRVIPMRGLESLVLYKPAMESLREIVNYEKARSVMYCQWGFEETSSRDQGATGLFFGEPGTGKSMAAEGLGFELGQPLKVVNCAELISKWVGETGKNIDAVFDEARQQDAVLVFDEAEGLFGHRHSGGDTATERYANVDVGLLLYHMERFPGVVVLTTNKRDMVDVAFMRRLKFVVEFKMPDQAMRMAIWRKLVPSKVPLADDVDFEELARSFEFSGGSVKSAIFRACSRAALRTSVATERVVTQADLVSACQHEMQKTAGM